MTPAPLLSPGSYESLRETFRWALPDRLNMAAQVCDSWAEAAPDRVALIEVSGARRAVTYAALRAMADGLAHDLAGRGVGRGDRVGVLRGQDAWCAAAHIAIWKIGAISIPLFKLFKHDALAARVGDAGAAWVVSDAESAQMITALEGARPLVPEEQALPAQPFATAETGPEDPAVLIYTSGTTGSPKGALHGHRMLTGHLPGVEMSHDFLGQPDDCLWTPADWAWIGGLFDVAMPGLAIGVPVVAARLAKFTPEECARIVREGSVRNIFFPPTALRMLKAADLRLAGLRSVASGGEPLGAEMLAWGRHALGVTINEFYGQTECNMVASSCAALFPPRPGCIGKPVPGFDIAVLDEAGNPAAGEGDVAIRRGAASMMLGYWNKPAETAAKFRGDWMMTGDRGLWEEGYLRFLGREDDVITSAGYRIGPAEIEDCLLKHPAVATVGVVGKPDALRTQIVKAYVVVKDGVSPSEALAGELQEFVKQHLAAHCFPREITFTENLPTTVTGKVIRKDLRARAETEDSR